MRKDMNGEQVTFLGTYDAIVIGGGVSGISVARTMAAEGLNVALIEPTGILGREVTRGYNTFVKLHEHADQSSSVREYYDCLLDSKGWFADQVDPTAAAVAFDELLSIYPVNVLFHVWPSRLLTEGRQVYGLEVACKSGRARLEAPKVIDASAHGKISKMWFRSEHADKQVSMVQLIYNGISGKCPEETVLLSTKAGDLRVVCRPTWWMSEWRVTLISNQRWSRAEWLLLLNELLIMLRASIPALQTGVLAHLSDDVSGEPELRISAESSFDTIAGYVIDPLAEADKSIPSRTVPIFQEMLCNPAVVDGLFMAGPWLNGFPYDPCREEISLVNAFLLGDMVGSAALLR
jgi:hypothetical protein